MSPLPVDPKHAVSVGWTLLDTEGVIWGRDVVAGLFGRASAPGAGAILAAAYVSAPDERDANVGFVGSKPPSRIWINDVRVEGDWLKMRSGGVGPKPVAFRKGVNVVVMEFELPYNIYRESGFVGSQYLGDGTALVLRDPATGKRDRELILGLREDDR